MIPRKKTLADFGDLFSRGGGGEGGETRQIKSDLMLHALIARLATYPKSSLHAALLSPSCTGISLLQASSVTPALRFKHGVSCFQLSTQLVPPLWVS